MPKRNLCVSAKFDAAHYLTGYKGLCANMHGHTWRVEFLFGGDKLDEIGMLVDFKILKSVINSVLIELDHNCLNAVVQSHDGDPAQNPTAENLAEWLFKKVSTGINERKLPVKLETVVVWESDNAWASYSD